MRARVVTTTVAGVAARVPSVDRWPRGAATVAQAPGGLGESIGQCFEDRDSLGRCGNRDAVEAGRNDGTRRRRRCYDGRIQRRKGS
jgi:hypothetical protein